MTRGSTPTCSWHYQHCCFDPQNVLSSTHQRRRDEQPSDSAAHPQGTGNISFSATLRRRLQKAEKGELADLLHEALRERENEATRQAATRLLGSSATRGSEEDDPAAGDEKRFEKAIAQAEAHNTRRALAVLAVAEQIPRDERTRQAMREKACVEVPLEEQLQVISASDWLITNVQHKPITQREAKAALARLAARGTRAPGPSGSRTNLLVAMGARAGGAQAVRDWTNIILEGLPPGLAQRWLSTILEPCVQGPRSEPTGGWQPHAGPTERRKVRPVTLAEMWVKLADDVASQRALPRVAAHLEPQQQGLNPTGLSKVIRCLRGWARQAEDNAAADPDAPARIIFSTDLENAFCCRTRSRALRETSLVDAHLARWNAVMWRSGSTQCWQRVDGGWEQDSTACGTPQGFRSGQQTFAVEATAGVRQALVGHDVAGVAIHDDWYFEMPHQSLEAF